MRRVLAPMSALVVASLVMIASTISAGAPHIAAASRWWQPGPSGLRWQWELGHALNVTNARDMGTNARLTNHTRALPPTVFDIDGIDNSAATVAALHRRGDRVICYVEVGSAGNYYSARSEGIASSYYAQFRSARVLGQKVNKYPERFLNIKSRATISIVESMIRSQCAAKGFDAVETDLDETYAGTEGTSGFRLSQAVEVSYMETLATFMHGLGLGWIAKNPDDTGDNYATLIAPFADGVLTEQCNQYRTCAALSQFIGKKAVLDAEYDLPTSSFCASDLVQDISGVRFTRSLDGTRHPCQ